MNVKSDVAGKAVYIAGPMTGKDNFNKEAFSEMERKLVKLGAKPVYNPARLIPFSIYADGTRGLSRAQLMRQDFSDLMASDVVVMLKGWKKSPGASCEHAMAIQLEIPVLYQ